jgi:hypothetical protein
VGIRITRGHLGYLVWGVAFCVVIIPEYLAASSTIDRHLPFCTISGTIGHLSYLYPWVSLIVIAVIVIALVSVLRKPEDDPNGPERTGGGRSTFTTGQATETSAEDFDKDPAPLWFLISAVGSFALLVGATIAAGEWWSDPPPKPGETNAHFHAGYVLYGGIALLWIVVPSIYLAVGGKEAPFPTLFRTIQNVEDWLRSCTWRWRLGPRCAWLVLYVIVAGLGILLFHLALYPFPDISHILNPSGQ